MRLPLLTVAMLAIAAQPAAAQDDARPYLALGAKPFWSLKIEGRTMRFETPGRRPVTVARPKVIHGFAGEIYDTRRINVNIIHKECRDTARSYLFRHRDGTRRYATL